jgi:hypothetical protein
MAEGQKDKAIDKNYLLTRSNEFERTIMPPPPQPQPRQTNNEQLQKQIQPQSQQNSNLIQTFNQSQTHSIQPTQSNSQTQIILNQSNQHQFTNHTQISNAQTQNPTMQANSQNNQLNHSNKPNSITQTTRSNINQSLTQNSPFAHSTNQITNQFAQAQSVNHTAHSLKLKSKSRTHTRSQPHSRSQSRTRSNTDQNELVFTIPTSNAYGQLNDDEMGDDTSSIFSQSSRVSRKRPKTNQTNENEQAKKQKLPASEAKPPPITIQRATRSQVVAFLDLVKADKSQFLLKFSPIGVKVIATSTAAHKFLRGKLEQDANAKFFTHQLREDQKTKIVLHGLYDMEVDELKQLLNDLDVNPVDIKKMNIRQKRYDDHTLYLIYFNKSDKVRVQSLQSEVPVINFIRVRWEYFQNRRDVIQCNRCLQFGHGGRNCFLDPSCIRCGESHASANCPHLIDPQTNETRKFIPQEKVKCGLCGQNHTANYGNCEMRKAFINRQKEYKGTAQRKSPRQHHTTSARFQDAPELNRFNFPSLVQTSGPAWSNPRTPQMPSQMHQQHRNQNSNFMNKRTELFSPSELTAITAELMQVMGRAKSPEDQIIAITQIVSKHIYGCP